MSNSTAAYLWLLATTEKQRVEQLAVLRGDVLKKPGLQATYHTPGELPSWGKEGPHQTLQQFKCPS